MSRLKEQTEPRIWGSNAAASWSVLFTPVFGAFLQARNWRSLGEMEKEKSALAWVYGGLAFLLALPFLGHGILLENPRFQGNPWTSLSFGFLLVWYFASGKSQAKYVKECYGEALPRNSWWIPIVAGIGFRIVIELYTFMVITFLSVAK